MPANWGNSAVATGLEKVSFHSNLKKAMPKNVETIIAHISHSSKVIFEILQAGLEAHELRISRC